MPPQNFEKNQHQIVRFCGIFAVKRRYEILAEMSDIKNELDKNKQLSIQCCFNVWPA